MYKTVGGESWSTVARRATGNDLDAAAIKRSNPGVDEPLAAGILIKVPLATEVLPDFGGGLIIRVNGEPLTAYDNFELKTSVDAISKGSFTVPNNQEMRDRFTPTLTDDVFITLDGKILFSGHHIDPKPEVDAISVSIESTPAILERATPSIIKFPLEWRGARLIWIFDDLCGEHWVDAVFSDSAKSRIKRADIQPGTRVLDFLQDIASQRGYIISSTVNGKLLVHRGEYDSTIVSFIEDGVHPTSEVKLEVDSSRYYSSVTGVMPKRSRRGRLGKHYTVKNPYRFGTPCAEVFEAPVVDEGELPVATKAQAGRMFAGLCACSVTLSSWYNDLGNLFEVGQYVKVLAERQYIRSPYTFMVRNLTLKKSSGQITSELDLCIPGVFSGEIPESMPWE